MKRYLVAAALALLLAPEAVLAQQNPEARIEAARRRAAEAGIPTTLLDTRVAEGRAKGVPAERIAAAVERRGTALARAQDAMRAARGLSEADLAAGADAVEAGIGEEPLRAVIARASRAEDRAVAIAVLTYLYREQGLPVDRALARVTEALDKGPEALRQLPAQARAQGRRGPPEGVGVGRPDHAGRGRQGGGPPVGLPTPGQKPGSGKPDGVGKPDGMGRPVVPGKPGGKPGGG